MAAPELLQKLETLFVDTGKAHHEAFASTGGKDPEWALWYADHLAGPVAELLGTTLTKSELVACLLAAEQEHHATDPEAAWPKYYAARFAECFAASPTATSDTLALYHFDGCGFCTIVRRAIDELGLDVELRNIWDDPEHRRALAQARGRTTVPVLRITTPDGEDRWMPESRDIIRYLKQMYG